MGYLFVRGHSLYHCWGMDALWVSLGVAAFSVVCVLYALVAIRSWIAAGRCRTARARRAYRTHVGVFVLCAVCGYGFELLAAFGLNVYRIRVLTLVLLASIAAAHLWESWHLGIVDDPIDAPCSRGEGCPVEESP